VRSPWFVLTAGFVGSRAFYALLGVRFDWTPFTTFWQYADPRAIQSDPLGSFLHFHIQPPLFNLVLAAAGRLSVSGLSVGLTLNAFFLALGYVLTVCSFALGRRLGLSPRQALVLALVISCNPVTILYENHLFYTYPTAVLLVVAVLLLIRYVASNRRRDAVVFFTALAAVILTRSLYHPLWFLMAGVVLLVLLLPGRRRDVFIAALGPFLVVVMVFAKNLVLFGELSSSSWLGMNMARVSTMQIPTEDRASLVKEGRLSTLALRPTFEYYQVYADTGYGTPPLRPTGHPVLDSPTRSNQSPNFNYSGYLGVYRQYRKDALVSMRLRPRAYLRGQALAHLTYLNSPGDFFAGDKGAGPASARNFQRVSRLQAMWRTAAYGQLPSSLTSSARKSPNALVAKASTIGIFAALALVGVTVGGLRHLRSTLGNRSRPEPTVIGALFAWTTILYVTVVANSLDVGENNRFRFEVEPLIIILTVWLAREAWRGTLRPHLQGLRCRLRGDRENGQAPMSTGRAAAAKV
jgi:hypothetical protein